MTNQTFGIIRTKSLVNRFTIRSRIIKMIENQEYVQYITRMKFDKGIVVSSYSYSYLL